jgi:hypothetical protein
MTVPLTVGSFSSHSVKVVLNESSLLVRCLRMGPCAGAFRPTRGNTKWVVANSSIGPSGS